MLRPISAITLPSAPTTALHSGFVAAAACCAPLPPEDTAHRTDVLLLTGRVAFLSNSRCSFSYFFAAFCCCLSALRCAFSCAFSCFFWYAYSAFCFLCSALLDWEALCETPASRAWVGIDHPAPNATSNVTLAIRFMRNFPSVFENATSLNPLRIPRRQFLTP